MFYRFFLVLLLLQVMLVTPVGLHILANCVPDAVKMLSLLHVLEHNISVGQGKYFLVKLSLFAACHGASKGFIVTVQEGRSCFVTAA